MWGHHQPWKYHRSKEWWWIIAFGKWFSLWTLSDGPAAELSQTVSSSLFSRCLSAGQASQLVSQCAALNLEGLSQHLLPPSSNISAGRVASCHRLTGRFIAMGHFSMEMQGSGRGRPRKTFRRRTKCGLITDFVERQTESWLVSKNHLLVKMTVLQLHSQLTGQFFLKWS